MSELKYQHGDVLLKRIDKLPCDVKKKKGNTLALGESTGHHHSLVKVGSSHQQLETVSGLSFYEDVDGNSYVDIDIPLDLKHQEHKTITVDPGIYEIDIVREFDYEANEVRRVVD